MALDQLFWIRARSAGGRRLFRHDEDRREFLSILFAVGRANRWRLWSWVLVADEYDLLVRGSTDAVCAAVRDLNAAYSRARGEGRLFAGRFAAVIVDVEMYLAPLAAWMFHRPVEEGLARDPARWRWSAYPDLARMRRSVIPIDRRGMLTAMGGERDGLRRLRTAVSQAPREMWNPFDHVTGQLVLGDRRFLESLRGAQPEVPAARAPDEVIAAVAQEWNVDADTIRRGRGGEPRATSALLLRESGLTLAAAGRALGVGGSAVSRLVSSIRRNGLSGPGESRLQRLRRDLGIVSPAAENKGTRERNE